jgi:hypothetical protein
MDWTRKVNPVTALKRPGPWPVQVHDTTTHVLGRCSAFKDVLFRPRARLLGNILKGDWRG